MNRDALRAIASCEGIWLIANANNFVVGTEEFSEQDKVWVDEEWPKHKKMPIDSVKSNNALQRWFSRNGNNNE